VPNIGDTIVAVTLLVGAIFIGYSVYTTMLPDSQNAGYIGSALVMCGSGLIAVVAAFIGGLQSSQNNSQTLLIISMVGGVLGILLILLAFIALSAYPFGG